MINEIIFTEWNMTFWSKFHILFSTVFFSIYSMISLHYIKQNKIPEKTDINLEKVQNYPNNNKYKKLKNNF